MTGPRIVEPVQSVRAQHRFGVLAVVIVLFLSAPIGFLIAGPTPERMMDYSIMSLFA